MHFNLPQLTYAFFFPPAPAITWTAVSGDFRLIVGSAEGTSSDWRLTVEAAAGVDSRTALRIRALLTFDCDSLFGVQSVSALNTRFAIGALAAAGHNFRLVTYAPGVAAGHSSLFTVREEDLNTN